MANAHLTLALADRRVRASIMRLPPTCHGDGDNGFTPPRSASRARRPTALSGLAPSACESAGSTGESAMQFTFTITDSGDAKRLEDDLRRDARIYTRSKKANGQSNVGKQFSQTQITVDGRYGTRR
jgi:hypothetical protein